MGQIAVTVMIGVMILIGASLLLLFTKWRYGKVASGLFLLAGAAGTLCMLLVFRDKLERIWSSAQFITLSILCASATVGGIAVIVGAVRCLQPKSVRRPDNMESEENVQNQGGTA